MIKKFDETMKGLAQGCASKWNYHTGGTKYGLSNLLNFCSSAIGVGALALSTGTEIEGIGHMMGLGSLLMNYEVNGYNRLYEKREIEALEKEALDFGVECRKSDKFIKYFTFFGGAALAGMGQLSEEVRNNLTLSLIGASFCILSFAEYVATTDFLPPKKGAIKEGLENLLKQEKVESSVAS